MSNNIIYVVAGPTASGKSSYAIKLAKEINGYIINADSRQVYKELTIGTAKPTPDEVKGRKWLIDGIEHYLYGHVSIKKDYNLYQYQKDVENILHLKKDSNQTPILVGGTGLYIDAIIHNYKLEKSTNTVLREELKKLSLKQLQKKTGKLLDTLNDSDRNNPIRLIRLIERGGRYEKGETREHEYIVIDLPKEELDKKIKDRIEQMFRDGLEQENKDLIKHEYTYYLKAMKSIGYQEFNEYFNGDKTLEEVKQEIITHTKQYAKRQRTWFKKKV